MGSERQTVKETKRGSYRFRLRAEVSYRANGIQGNGVVRDISRGGVLIDEASQPLNPGTRGSIELTFLDEADFDPFDFEVIRSTANNLALRFTNLEPAVAGELSKALAAQRRQMEKQQE